MSAGGAAAAVSYTVRARAVPGHPNKERTIAGGVSPRSPNICTIHEIDETADGQLYLVVAYYETETLKERFESLRARQTEQGLADLGEPLFCSV